MLNKEKFKDEIFEIACNGGTLALNRNTGKITSCSVIHCADCEFKLGVSCDNECRAWCNSEYKEPEIDWSKVPVDTPIYVKPADSYVPRYFAGKYSNDEVYYFDAGRTSFTSKGANDKSFISVDMVKLAREEDIEKYSR